MQTWKGGLTAVLTVLLLVNTTLATESGRLGDSSRDEFLVDRAQIIDLRDHGDVNAVTSLAEATRLKWAEKDKERYAILMLTICSSLRSTRLAGPRAAGLARQYALSTLRDANEISLETELQLIGQVTSDLLPQRAPAGNDWLLRRKEDVAVRLHGWNRLEQAIDRSWDPNEFWSLVRPRPPLDVPWVTGNPPEVIRDPNVRAEYVAALEESRRQVEYHNTQRRLRRLKSYFTPLAARYIARVYSIPPFNTEELRRLLNEYGMAPAVRAEILDLVNENMASQKPAQNNEQGTEDHTSESQGQT